MPSVRDRITQLQTYLVNQIRCSKTNVIIGRYATGPGPAQELTIGSGLQITGTTLSATGGGGGGILPISSKVVVAANMALDSSHNGKLLEFTGGQTVTLPAPIVGMRCWLAINLGGEVINFAGTHPRIGLGMATTSMQESYGIAELEGCSDYWLLKQITSHLHSISDIVGLETAMPIGGSPPVNESFTVAGAGSSAMNGTYVNYGTANGKPKYSKDGTDSYPRIYWSSGFWVMDVTGNAVADYSSNQDVATPDLVTTWNVVEGVGPAPTVTKTPATPAGLFPIRVDSDFIYVVSSVVAGVPTWKEVRLSALGSS